MLLQHTWFEVCNFIPQFHNQNLIFENSWIFFFLHCLITTAIILSEMIVTFLTNQNKYIRDPLTRRLKNSYHSFAETFFNWSRMYLFWFAKNVFDCWFVISHCSEKIDSTLLIQHVGTSESFNLWTFPCYKNLLLLLWIWTI